MANFPGRFLRTIFAGRLSSGGLELELRCIHASKPVIRRFWKSVEALAEDWDEVIKANARGHNVYFGVVPRDPANDHKLPEPLVLTCLWVDIDIAHDKPFKSIKRALKLLRRFKLKPTMVVKSGHGLHVYWCFKEPVTLEVSRAKELLRSLAERIGGDLQSAEPARLLRMPGTFNWKQKNAKKLCKVICLKPNRRYRLTQLKKQLSVAKKEPQKSEIKNPQDYFEFFTRHVKELRKTSTLQAMGSCPFHDDKNPSWSLRTSDGVWHCFGCARSGNAVSFCLQRGIDPAECPGAAEVLEHRAIAIENGGYITWKREGGEWRKTRISDFVIKWKRENRVSDHIRVEDRLFEGKIVTKTGERVPIRVTNDEFCSNQALYTVLVRECGSKIWLNERFVNRVREASLLFSKAKMQKTNMDFGFQDDGTFLTPTLKITAKSILEATDSQIDLHPIEHARHLDLKIASKRRRKELLKHVCNDLLELQPHRLTYTLLGLIGGAPLMHFMQDKTRYALWIVGPSGSGKSFIAKLFQCFFGDFAAEGRVASWSSTINSLQYLGYFFKDCVFLLDDYKPAMVRNEGSVVQFLQTYADFYARSRLTSEIKSRKDYFVRGLLLTTGEDVPSGHASVVARSLILHINKRKPDLDRGRRCSKNCSAYSALMARYIYYLLRCENLRSQLLNDLKESHDFFLKDIEREENSVRIARNLALSWLGFKWFTRFLKAAKAPFDVRSARKEHKRDLLVLRRQMLMLILEEQPAQVFIEALREAIDNEVCKIRDVSNAYGKVRDKSTVGFEKNSRDPYVYIFPPEAMAVVRQQLQRLGRRFDWTPNAVSKALEAGGYLVRSARYEDSAIRKRVQKKLYRVWKLRKECLGFMNDRGEEK